MKFVTELKKPKRPVGALMKMKFINIDQQKKEISKNDQV